MPKFVISCNHCQVDEAWTTEDAARAAAVWHVYLHHREIWNLVMGDRPPKANTPPEAYGRRLEQWERQS